MMVISGICDWSITLASFSTLGLAPWLAASRDMYTACAWWAIIPCMNSTSATVIPAPGGISILGMPLIPCIPAWDIESAWAKASDEPATSRAERASARAAHLAITTTSLEYLNFMYGQTSPGVEHSSRCSTSRATRSDCVVEELSETGDSEAGWSGHGHQSTVGT